jgi:tRNA (guanine37-N1)-methyltransferase
MRITVVTLFPEAFDSPLSASLLGKARAAGLIAVDFVNPRDFTRDKHRSVDDAPYGGGHGMVMKPQPLVEAIESVAGSGAHRVLLTPVGAPLDQARVRQLAARPHLVLVCGRYEGVDERVSQLAIDEEISLGDFVLSGGEFAALAVIDAISRLVPGVLGELASTEEESFSDGSSLEYPQYTRPPEFRGLAVPEVLISGHHEKVRAWRRRESLRRTAARRPELLARRPLSAADRALVAGDPVVLPAARTYAVLAHHPVLDRTGQVVTSSITNLDVHDIARSAATYGLAGYEIVTPVAAQREKIEHMARVWLDELREEGARAGHGHRGHALAPIRVHESIEAALAAIGGAPLVVATSARPGERRIGYRALLRLLAGMPDRPLALLFGTGHGLADPVIASSDHVLDPIEGQSEWNHLSVRSAAAVVFDRLFGAGA